MKRLKYLILIFALALSIPLAYLVARTWEGLHQEELAELRYFGDTLFDEMEAELAALVQREEGRLVDEYNYYLSSSGAQKVRSPLSYPPQEAYILGYFQNNPDGSFQSPLVPASGASRDDRRQVPAPKAPEQPGSLADLKEANTLLNQQRLQAPEGREPQAPLTTAKAETPAKAALPAAQPQSVADKYLAPSRSKKTKTTLGQQQKRIEEITKEQAYNLSRKQSADQAEAVPQQSAEAEVKGADRVMDSLSAYLGGRRGQAVGEADEARSQGGLPNDASFADAAAEGFRAELDPLQSLYVDSERILLFRRIVIQNQVYRQGFLLDTGDFLRHLAQSRFVSQPMSHFTQLELRILDPNPQSAVFQAGARVENPAFSLQRIFPRPFDFLRASLTCEQIPPSAGRRTLALMLIIMGLVVLVGLLAVYQSARAVMALSERRADFVSSVTHELKTPLTNIRLYIEMLEQGVARTREREQEYFTILGSESARLSRLIDNVLEFSKLEKRRKRLKIQSADFTEVIREVRQIMDAKIRQENFTLEVDYPVPFQFAYDHEAMVQVLINLIENSLKFGRDASVKQLRLAITREDCQALICLSDTGPGILRHELNKVFNDFFRGESPQTTTARGTGIGLALVRKYVLAMGGKAYAANNEGPGCTICILLPVEQTS